MFQTLPTLQCFNKQSFFTKLLNNVIAIVAGEFQSLALRSDGTVVAWGWGALSSTPVPDGLNRVIAVAAGFYQSLALKSDGTVVARGYNLFGRCAVPEGLHGVIAIAAGGHHSLALVVDPPAAQIQPLSQTAETGTTVDFWSDEGGSSTLTYQWFFNSTNALTGLIGDCDLQLTNVQPTQAGTYFCVAANLAGAVTSAPAMLNVVPPVQRMMVPALSLLG